MTAEGGSLASVLAGTRRQQGYDVDDKPEEGFA